MKTKFSCKLDSCWHAFLLCAVLISAFPAMAQPVPKTGAEEGRPLQFDIPRQPLASALDSYSATTGIVGLYRAQLAIGRLSRPIAGRYTPEAALRLLLDNSGLAAQYASAEAFVLVPSRHNELSSRSVAAVARAAIAQQDDAQRAYSGLLQDRINVALCASGSTRPGDYRIALNFRVGASGEIEQFNLLGSSGDSRRDAAISSALRGLPIGRQAPSHMSQPFTMVVLPPSSGGAVTCPPIRSAARHG